MDFYDLFWGVDFPLRELKLLSTTHIISLLVSIAFLFLIITFREHIKNSKYKNIFVQVIGWGVILSQVLMYIWYLHTGWFNIHDSLPLYISRLSAIISGIMILRQDKKLFDIMYFWGIIPPLIALLFPDIDYFSFPHIRFWFFYIGHAFTIFAVIYMMVVENMRPTIYSFKKATTWFLVYSAVAFVFNVFTHSNYGYYMHLPKNLFFLEKYLPWPFYLPVFIGSQILVFYMLYLPFKKRSEKSIFIS